MPANNGSKPPHELVDIKLRNGLVIRDVEPDKWRWKSWPDGESAGDIVIWQPAGLLRRWDGKKSP